MRQLAIPRECERVTKRDCLQLPKRRQGRIGPPYHQPDCIGLALAMTDDDQHRPSKTNRTK